MAAATESQVSAERLTQLPGESRDTLGGVRKGSLTDRMVDWMPANPIFTVDDIGRVMPGPTSSMYASVEKVRDAGIVEPLTGRKRDQVWGVASVLKELDDLGVRIAARTR